MSYYGYNLSSPALQHDYNEFIKTNPDIYTMIDWLKDHVADTELLDYNHNDPEELFEHEDLESWSEKNGWKYKPQVDDFPDSELEDWAKDHGFVKREDTKTDNIDNFIKDGLGRMSLTWIGDDWIIFDHTAEETVFEGETKEELNDTIGDFFMEQEIQRRKVAKEKADAEYAAKHTSKKRGRPRKNG